MQHDPPAGALPQQDVYAALVVRVRDVVTGNCVRDDQEDETAQAIERVIAAGRALNEAAT